MDAQKRSVEERVEEQYAFLLETVSTATALRLRRRLQPAGGAGDKVFPPTYEGGKYALETRIIDGEQVPCVLLDSVQSQANRMELALLRAHREKKIRIPIISVDFGHAGVEGVGVITSLEAPHRIADAILRDSLYEGIKFRESPYGKILETPLRPMRRNSLQSVRQPFSSAFGIPRGRAVAWGSRYNVRWSQRSSASTSR